MSNLIPEKVLRVNCPGFGVSLTLPLGEAKPLAMYDVIVVNPTSILHLFDQDSNYIRQIEQLLEEGRTKLSMDSAEQLESIQAELELREHELKQFLAKGGLLVYFLAPPFIVENSSLSLSNYAWLYEWAPGIGQATINLVSGSKHILINKRKHPFASYLQQAGLEWSTVVNNLGPKYKPLAYHAANKCIAAYAPSGPKRGQVVCLPYPFQEQYEDKLKECLLRWYEIHTGPDADQEELDSDDRLDFDLGPDIEGYTLLKDMLPQDLLEKYKIAAVEGSVKTNLLDWPELNNEDPVKREAKQKGINSVLESLEALETKSISGAHEAALEASEACNLISRLEQETNLIPSWCVKVSFPELKELCLELNSLKEEARRARLKIAQIEECVGTLMGLKNALLSCSGNQLNQACIKAFETMGWTVKISPECPYELWLNDGDKMQALVRIVSGAGQPKRTEVAELSQSIIAYWDKYDMEPKGILLAGTFNDLPPDERVEEDFPPAMQDFARRKNLCLLTGLQLLSIYRDVSLKQGDARQIREEILTTNGALSGFKLEFTKEAAPEPINS